MEERLVSGGVGRKHTKRKQPPIARLSVRAARNTDERTNELTLAACELKPPMLPAMADPTRFLAMLHSTIWSTVVLRTDDTVLPDSIVSTCVVSTNTEDEIARADEQKV